MICLAKCFQHRLGSFCAEHVLKLMTLICRNCLALMSSFGASLNRETEPRANHFTKGTWMKFIMLPRTEGPCRIPDSNILIQLPPLYFSSYFLCLLPFLWLSIYVAAISSDEMPPENLQCFKSLKSLTELASSDELCTNALPLCRLWQSLEFSSHLG